MNQFILADPEKCIGCRTCEVACMMSHQSSATPEAFTSRIRVVKGGTFTTAVGCHQCENAPCANVCPTGAIHRAAGAWLVKQSRCIGCKSCMVACPFGAMQVRVVEDRVQALKCDLCAHREGGPACVEACPTHALRCIDPARLRAERLRNLA
ncbi:4Fe-4S dicluster domain-containing protein [Enterobacter hormaechei subsp. xiangfangensis]|uniref:4Fe-4S dicluster domain-containing protein n=1 Tax=Enterobacter hormaechei TaxID=158836 RepID=UPI0018A58F08|nr:4Fe-4S dicluster domain-containing protein [Enterobacter hormaechei]EMA0460448.1 4Fe-4S dicluster domain-containing protein [Enterobacter hormaechei subsp. hoffmannii]MBW9411472.1 4Fe-4S dicluster domain-containing protein [Enterobacter hormaechei]MCR6684312.1 4Fe-4S dicluster domain-containing protein [Enterobacter hormaechei]MDE7583156.1 4Fe-4S dicluster domain-containing protein [Enterobacter hormaechei]MED5649249.1 4Fe-4S dicluster domain-containing protein [Enterobacter hormaechei]